MTDLDHQRAITREVARAGQGLAACLRQMIAGLILERDRLAVERDEAYEHGYNDGWNARDRAAP